VSDVPEALMGLHDATLASIVFDWASRRCTLHFHGAPSADLQHPFSIVFEDVTEVSIPSERPWGPSPSVLEVDGVEPGRYVFVMQSGDEIWVSSPTEPIRTATAK
jgi:hypothetical protein